ncbi:MAG: hypothetical protein SF162_02550 [bacterium]|nr:hypothetical protein [bacterium]
MQISRHWRINQQRYRLQGVRLTNGEVSLHNRQVPAVAERESVQTVSRDQRTAVVTFGR